MDAIAGLNHWLDGFSEKLAPSQKKELMRILAQGMRLRFKDRITGQRDPDGHRFIPRKRDQIGNIKRQGAMFKSINKQLKTTYTAVQAEIGFAGRNAYVASVHQYGKTIRPTSKVKPTRYSIRELVGFGEDDQRWAMSIIEDYLLK
ncbi:phage virion morphogenesis protein [Acinetobacter piscicola]|uniref:phage virion morphogenesis protein n=1 Tax=Acinetobacter piscicola TaxID=2006115 RepID=UPI001020FF60|nr:phage virion morphogenesis protein [Acinetobacter piscicola]RYL25910.1 phage virion morphogenesis protein [Acinetobacter piscicola]